jgi:uncharacterized protein YraI
MGRDILIVAAVAIVAVVAYPSVAPYLPYSWRANIAAITGQFGSVADMATLGSAVVLSDLNLREGPSTRTAVVALVPRGSNVATIEKRGEWMFVQIEADNRAQPRRGWVYGSFLREIEADEPESSDDSD